MKIYYSNEPTGDDNADKILNLVLEKCKYQIMWHLRHLEDEINNEKEGIITLVISDNKKGVGLKGFSKELAEKILDIVNKIDLRFLS